MDRAGKLRRQPAVLASPASACWRLGGGEASSYTHSWMRGGRAGPDQGKLEQAPVASPYSRKLEGSGTAEWVPWTALHREDGPKDGWFMALEYLGRWSLSVDRAAAGPLAAAAVLPELKSIALQPGQRLGLPPVTFGVFHNGLDAHGGVAVRLAIRIPLGLHQRVHLARQRHAQLVDLHLQAVIKTRSRAACFHNVAPLEIFSYARVSRLPIRASS